MKKLQPLIGAHEIASPRAAVAYSVLLCLAPSVCLLLLCWAPLTGSFHPSTEEQDRVDYAMYSFYFQPLYGVFNFGAIWAIHLFAFPPLAKWLPGLVGAVSLSSLAVVYWMAGPQYVIDHPFLHTAGGLMLSTFILPILIFHAVRLHLRYDKPSSSSSSPSRCSSLCSLVKSVYTRHLFLSCFIFSQLWGVYMFCQFAARVFAENHGVASQLGISIAFQVGFWACQRFTRFTASYFDLDILLRSPTANTIPSSTPSVPASPSPSSSSSARDSQSNSRKGIDEVTAPLYFPRFGVTFMTNVFYFCFYRTLFAEIGEPTGFVVMHLAHIVLELCFYGLRISPSVARINRKLVASIKTFFALSAPARPPATNSYTMVLLSHSAPLFSPPPPSASSSFRKGSSNATTRRVTVTSNTNSNDLTERLLVENESDSCVTQQPEEQQQQLAPTTDATASPLLQPTQMEASENVDDACLLSQETGGNYQFLVSSDEFFSPTAWVEATIGDVDWHWLKTHAFCVEYGLRSAANTMGSLAYLTVTLSAQFCPYTKHLFSAVSPADTTIREHQGDLSVVNVFYVYLSVSLILDVVLFAGLNWYYRRLHADCSIWRSWSALLSWPRMRWFLFFSSCHVATDIVLSRLVLKF